MSSKHFLLKKKEKKEVKEEEITGPSHKSRASSRPVQLNAHAQLSNCELTWY